jgi:RNA polymerase sigma factor (sigma-70 family)
MDPRSLTDEELVRLLLTTREEDLRAELWAEFLRRFQPVIAVTAKRRLARRRHPDHTLVDARVSDTFFKLYDHDLRILRNFEFRPHQPYGFRAFLKVIAANVVEDYFRKEKIQPEPIDDNMPDRSDLVDALDRRDKVRKIEACLQQLAGKPNFPRDYKIFWLYFREGYTAQAIAELPEIRENVKTVESVLLRLIKWIRQCLRRRDKKN